MIEANQKYCDKGHCGLPALFLYDPFVIPNQSLIDIQDEVRVSRRNPDFLLAKNLRKRERLAVAVRSREGAEIKNFYINR